MALSFCLLDYRSLLGLPDKEAFLTCLGSVLHLDIDDYLQKTQIALGTPTPVTQGGTRVTFTDSRGILMPAVVSYQRLDLGSFITEPMDLCIAPPDTDSDADALTALLSQVSSITGVYFDPARFTLISRSTGVVPETYQIAPAADHYVFQGILTLYGYPANHLALKTPSGTSQGLQLADLFLQPAR